MSQWQPIETAPKDGFEILVCNASSEIKPYYVAYWIEGTGWLIWSDDKHYKTCDPTHWMPIPKHGEQSDTSCERAVAEEREACALEAEQFQPDTSYLVGVNDLSMGFDIGASDAAEGIAAAIRKRGEV